MVRTLMQPQPPEPARAAAVVCRPECAGGAGAGLAALCHLLPAAADEGRALLLSRKILRSTPMPPSRMSH